MDAFSEIEWKIRNGRDITYDEYQKIRSQREYIDDLEETLRGIRSGVAAEGPSIASIERASGPAVAIVVGHTQNSPGASGGAPINESEYTWNSDLADKIKVHCQSKNIESRIFYRDGIGISGAYQKVRQWGAACVMELHFNAYNRSAHGTETLYDNDTNSGSRAWAQRLQDGMLGALGTHNRGLKERDPGDRGYRSVSAVDIPSALIEPFFGDNPQDAQRGHANKDALAEALANAAVLQLAPLS